MIRKRPWLLAVRTKLEAPTLAIALTRASSQRFPPGRTSTEPHQHMVSDVVVPHLQGERPRLDRRPIDSGGNNAAADSVRVFHQDLIECCAVPDRHLEAWPGLRNARV